MPYRTLYSAPVFVLRWVGSMEREDFAKHTEELRAHVQSTGHKVKLLVLIPASNPVPSAELRKIASQQADIMLETCCESMDAVILGEGILFDLIRTVMRGLSLLMRHRTRAVLHESTEKALARMLPGQPIRVNGIMAELRRQGFLSAALDTRVA